VKPTAKYKANLSNQSLLLQESRIVAGILMDGITPAKWRDAIVVQNILQKRSPSTAKRLASLVRSRLEPMGEDLWTLVKNGNKEEATHAVLAAVVKQSAILRDFLDIALREQVNIFKTNLTRSVWENYLLGCRERDPLMSEWTEKSERILGNVIYRILAESGYINNTRSLTIQSVHIAPSVLSYLEDHDEQDVLRCLQVSQ
jgi:hypothetical protein